MGSEATETIAERVDAFVERALALTDEERLAIAEVRRGVPEGFHVSALRAAASWLPGRADLYARARNALAKAHVPFRLLDEDDEPSGAERERLDEVARLVQLAIDDMLLCLIASDVLHPDHLRELSRPWSLLAPYAAASTPSRSSP